MRKILITGATGFVGRHLLKQLLKNENNELVLVVRPGNKKLVSLTNNPRITLIYQNMNEYSLLPNTVKTDIYACVHLAWNGTRGVSRNDKEKQEKNYLYSMDILNSAIALHAKKFICAGSQAEYGISNTSLSEDSVAAPYTEYGKYKIKFYIHGMEKSKESGVNFIEPRFFSLYGEEDAKETMIVSILTNMLKNNECNLTDCEQMWNFLYVDDAIRGVINFINTEQKSGAYNFGSTDTRKLKNFILEMKSITKSKSKLNFGAIPHNDTGVFGIQPNIDKLLSTGWKPVVCFAEGIQEVVKALKHE